MHRSFAGCVGKVVELRHADAVDRADVDHARRSARPPRLLDQRQKLLGEVEDSFDVGVHRLVEAVLGKIFELGAPTGAGVVDQDVELRFAGRKLAGDTAAFFDRREIGRNGNASAVRREFGCDAVANVRFARRDVNVGAGLDVRARDHQADAPGAACDQRSFAGNGEKIFYDRGTHREAIISRPALLQSRPPRPPRVPLSRPWSGPVWDAVRKRRQSRRGPKR